MLEIILIDNNKSLGIFSNVIDCYEAYIKLEKKYPYKLKVIDKKRWK